MQKCGEIAAILTFKCLPNLQFSRGDAGVAGSQQTQQNQHNFFMEYFSPTSHR